MQTKLTGRLAAASSLFLLMSTTAFAGESAEDKIARAMSAAPAAVSAEATIMDTDGSILREGSNGWTCLPDTQPGDHAPMCNDATWMKLMMAMMNQQDFEAGTIGISYMMQGEPDGAGVSINMERRFSTPRHSLRRDKNTARFVDL